MTVCDRPGAESQARPETLDPEDWDQALAVARQILDDSVAYLRDVRERPVWRRDARRGPCGFRSAAAPPR